MVDLAKQRLANGHKTLWRWRSALAWGVLVVVGGCGADGSLATTADLGSVLSQGPDAADLAGDSAAAEAVDGAGAGQPDGAPTSDVAQGADAADAVTAADSDPGPVPGDAAADLPPDGAADAPPTDTASAPADAADGAASDAAPLDAPGLDAAALDAANLDAGDLDAAAPDATAADTAGPEAAQGDAPEPDSPGADAASPADAVNPPQPATDLTGQPCNDANACTLQDQWFNGNCLGQWKSCEDGKPCTSDICATGSGACSHLSLGGLCDDGNACTQGESCSKTNDCTDGGPVDCDDGLPCTADSCAAKVGCVHTPVKVGQGCGSNGAVCLTSGACAIATSCQGMPALCDDKEACTIDFCEPLFGCMHLTLPDKSSCDDGDSCTPFATDRCTSGTCGNQTNVCGCQIDSDCAQFDDGDLCNGIYACTTMPTGKKQCKPKAESQVQCPQPGSSSCHAAACDPQTGLCLASPLSDGAWCDDGEPCTAKSVCKQGACQSLGLSSCDDGNPCTIDSCSPGSGCVNQASSGGVCGVCPQCDDGNPCTVDSCGTKGDCGHAPQLCNTAGDPCITAACVVTGPQTWSCVHQPKASTAPLNPPLACKIFAAVSGCPSGYQCIAPPDMPEAALCQPKVSVVCSDGNACTVGDLCSSSSCLPGAPANCDDDNPCTADSCAGPSCAHKPIAGCNVCVNEGFQSESYWPQWASFAEDEGGGYVAWELAQEAGGNQRQVAQWKGPYAKGNVNQGAHLFSRRLHLGPGVAAQLDFGLRAYLATPTCGSDDLEAYVNGTLVWRLCQSTPGGSQGSYQHITVDLSAFAGSPIDIEFRVLAGAEPSSGGKIELDKVRVAGGCSEACMGGHLESTSTARDVPSSAVPQGWKLTSSDPNYVAWGRTYTGGNHGLGAMTAHWTGKSASGEAQTAQLRVALVHPAKDSKLHFAARAVFAGDPTCASDVLTVRIAGTKVFELCGPQANWKYKAIDLAPWAGMDVDVIFEVKTGTTASSLGLFQVDDLSLTGACSYACFLSNFEDPEATNHWWKGNTAGAPAWTQQPPVGQIDGVVKAQLPASLAAGAMTTLMPTDKWRWPMPVNGASFELTAQLTAEANTCPAAQFRTRLVYGYRGVPPTEPKEVLTSPFMFDLVSQCQTGPTTFKLELGDPIRGQKFLPLFVLQKAAGLAAGSGGVGVELDDLVIRCR